MVYKSITIKLFIFFSFLIINRQMQGEDKTKHAFNEISHSNLKVTRQDSFINKMTIFGSGFFQRLPSQSRDIPVIPEQPVYAAKEEPVHGNVFKGFKRQEVQRPIEPKLNSTQAYQRQCLQYEKYLFDSRIKMIIKRMAIKAYNMLKTQKEGQFFIFPVQKLLITIAKKMLLNRFELFFLQYALEQTKWRYETDCIKKHAHHFKSYLMLPDSQISTNEIKYMEVYILFCAYFSKKSLNELAPDNMFLNYCQEICPRFKDFFPEWTQNYGMGAKINPKQLNNIFKKLTFNCEKDHQEFENYCLVVEQILDISPAYNADKSGKPKKARKAKKEPKNKEEQDSPKNEQQYSQNRLPEIVHQDESLDIEPPIFRQKKSSVLSVDLLQANHYLTRSASQHERR